MDFYDETTRQALAAIIALGTTGVITFASIRFRQRERAKHRRLRRHH